MSTAPKLTYSAYLQEVADFYKDPSSASLRLGQAYFHVLYRHRPDLGDLLTSQHRDLDPFYQDQNLDKFCKWVESKLDK